MLAANDIRKGQVIKFNGEPHLVMETQHRTPGNLRAFVQVKMRNLRYGKSLDQRFGSTDSLEVLPTDRRTLEFSYSDRDSFAFIDPESFDQIELSAETIGDVKNYLTAGGKVDVLFVDDKALTVELPSAVTLKIVESSDGIKGDTASNVQKPAKLETGMMIQVPLFVKEGELVRVSTADGTYLGRAMKQRTLVREVSIKGSALHTGDVVNLTMKPAPAGHGIVFKRMDLQGQPELRPRVDQVTDLVRSTTIQVGHAKIHTVEHVLSALHGCGIDNVIVEMDASEPPIMDGSARAYVNMILQGEPVEQDKEREYFELDAPVSVTRGNSSIIALPSDTFKISCTSADDRGIHTQHLSLAIDPETYAAQIAPARTFTIYEDIEELLKLGKIRGGSLDCAVVIKGDKIMSKEPLRFKEEFVRHKILDIIGDVMLLGLPLKAHIVATRPGHAINAQLTKILFDKLQEQRKAGAARRPRREARSSSRPRRPWTSAGCSTRSRTAIPLRWWTASSSSRATIRSWP